MSDSQSTRSATVTPTGRVFTGNRNLAPLGRRLPYKTPSTWRGGGYAAFSGDPRRRRHALLPRLHGHRSVLRCVRASEGRLGRAEHVHRADGSRRAAALSADAGWAGTVDENATVAVEQPFRLRFEVEHPAAGASTFDTGVTKSQPSRRFGEGQRPTACRETPPMTTHPWWPLGHQPFGKGIHSPLSRAASCSAHLVAALSRTLIQGLRTGHVLVSFSSIY